MKTEKKYKFSVIKDENGEIFSMSKCTCNDCLLMHLSQKEWDIFKPKTNLQKRMVQVVKSIEKKQNKRKT
jgi:hypothetical protein